MLNDSPLDSNNCIHDILKQLQEIRIGNETPRIQILAINEGEISYNGVVSFTFSYDDTSLFVTSKMKCWFQHIEIKQKPRFSLV